ncbi:putative sulfite reductase [NADPH] flavoprotein component [Psilocybe cubensis]|uniref:Sulfite reductase [NADPH] flavoprotein component n=1 Tax=Psilocybe cubensis TaxID=181762 RepID=A0ACB8H4X3_PSICU|nr:putative sulfite reductase [NADPH] flavoprotein component [Psilocybe cubensis]KAH9482818.1 putative sulfite reductase [NADPH] flavoprotein component [Psilocybe cubensis]
MSLNGSGLLTPSSEVTLSSPPSTPKHLANKFSPPNGFPEKISIANFQASQLVEYISSRPENSSSVYIYDVAEQVGFGTATKEWAKNDHTIPPTVDLQTRAGAGLSLVGRLSQGTSIDAVKGTVLTAYTTPSGLALMAPSFAHLPAPSATTRLIVQVPTVTAVGETLAFSPTLSPLASVWSILPENVSVLLSSSPKQTVDFAALAYKVTSSHIVHLFDHYSAARENGPLITPPKPISNKGKTLQESLKEAGYEALEYHGDAEAKAVVVLLNSTLASSLKAAVASNASGLAVVVVNVLRPWDESAIRSIIPASATSVYVLDDVPNTVTQGSLYVDVFSALWGATPKRSVTSHRITPSQTQKFVTSGGEFLRFVENITHLAVEAVTVANIKKTLFFSTPDSPLAHSATLLRELFSSKPTISARHLVDYDVFSKPGGIAADRLLISRDRSTESIPVQVALPLDSSSVGHSDFLGVTDHTLLKTHSILKHAKKGSIVVVVSPWTPEEFSSNISHEVAELIVERQLSVYTIDIKTLAKGLSKSTEQHNLSNGDGGALLFEIVFLRFFLGAAASEQAINQLLNTVYFDLDLTEFCSAAWKGLKAVTISLSEVTPSESPALKEFEANAIAVKTSEGQTVVNGARLSTWHDAAKHLLFPAAFTPPTEPDALRNPALRPEVPDTTFLVTCTVNKRLTPLEYDRNVFHLEFDTSGTGLKYAIGEALGVHGWNDEQEVLEFCEWYGVDPDRLITIPVPGSDDTKMHTRTVLQALQQQIDLFGKPPKSFYTDLAEYATADVDRYALRFIGAPEGSSTFKKLSEKDTVTFADVLKMYKSAKPGIERLCELIGDIKPRHYSIASAQSVVGDRVDLLVVTVDWVTPSGLKIGQKVTVSIKPSVMKLPPDVKQPLIMAGLGTGAAPFRAFLQHLAWLASKGEEIGPVYYYFGSRYQAAEYLYGEEIEAFLLSGVITRAGLAFSRDGPKKVYIQHKMLEDSDALAKMLHEENGVFYLCGPTWPVPDVYEALVNALTKYKGDTVQAGEYLESLKEEERYVLEVY